MLPYRMLQLELTKRCTVLSSLYKEQDNESDAIICLHKVEAASPTNNSIFFL